MSSGEEAGVAFSSQGAFAFRLSKEAESRGLPTQAQSPEATLHWDIPSEL